MKLHILLTRALMFFRRQLDFAARGRMWSGSVGQHDLFELLNMKQDFSSRIARITGLEKWLNKLRMTGTVDISGDSKALVLEEVRRIVEACDGSEDTMWSYRGQMSLRALDEHPIDSYWCVDTQFDESIIAWHIATNALLESKDHPKAEEYYQLHDAIKLLSNYMMFLLVDHPYMLPSPVRARQYDLAYRHLSAVADHRSRTGNQDALSTPSEVISMMYRLFRGLAANESRRRGATLAKRLLGLYYNSKKLERVLLGVWVEMLCYAASHCSRDSHAKHLNSGPQLITVVWILQTTLFNSIYDEDHPMI